MEEKAEEDENDEEEEREEKEVKEDEVKIRKGEIHLLKTFTSKTS